MESLRRVLANEPRIMYALVFGSAARGSSHPGSDVDVAVGVRPGSEFTTPALGALVADLERASGRRVDLVIVGAAPPSVAYRVFRDGITLFVRDARLMADDKTRAILGYLDFRPIEQRTAQGALAAAARG